MDRGVRIVCGLSGLVIGCLLGVFPSSPGFAQGSAQTTVQAQPQASSSSQPIEITADRLKYFKEREVYEADGSVVIIQNSTKLTADHVTVHMLTGQVLATGQVHLSKRNKDVWADRLELNLNTEAGVLTNSKLFAKDTNTFITAQRLQRFSEDHYRVNDGSFTNCDVMEGQTPAWRFTFEEADLQLGDSLQLQSAWFCVNDIPVLPIPQLSYPVGATRKTGFLMPSPGYNSEFGFHYRQGFFWAINPSHDLTITPNVLSDRGYGGDLEYRYALGRQNKGQWLVNGFRDTDKDRMRSLVNGSHVIQVNPDLRARGKAFVVSDRTYLKDLANTGVLRALPSADSFLDVKQRLPYGAAYLFGQYLQPLQTGNDDTFQRFPEIGVEFANWSPLDGPFFLGVHSNYVNWFREEGFDFSRVDFMPTLAAKPLVFGNVVGLTAQVRPRVVYYTRGVNSDSSEDRETLWTSLRVDSRLKRSFQLGQGTSLLHTIEPDAIYEFVPPTDQSDIIQVDEVDDLPKKSLLTYKLRNKLIHANSNAGANNWLDLVVAQSYRLGATQNEARVFPFPGSPAFDEFTQPLQTPKTPVDGKKFSDIWARGILGREDLRPGARAPNAQFLTIDTFFDPYNERFRQVNADFRYQYGSLAYFEVGQRYTKSGNRVKRGDLWNPISFAEVFEPTEKILFGTTSAAIRTPLGWTVGGRVIHDFETGKTTEYDVVGLYQNPCRCWSLGLYFVKFSDRSQFNFLINLTDIGNTDSFGTKLLRTILSPLLQGERGLPWREKALF